MFVQTTCIHHVYTCMCVGYFSFGFQQNILFIHRTAILKANNEHVLHNLEVTNLDDNVHIRYLYTTCAVYDMCMVKCSNGTCAIVGQY